MKHFTMNELSRTSTGLDNTPNVEIIDNLTALVDNVLDPLRELIGMPIHVSSGYRSAAVNKAVKGAANSQHTKGEAADISCKNNGLLFRLIRDNFTFDQLIWEFGDDNYPAWVHVSYSKKNRKQVLRAIKVKSKTKYVQL